MKDYRETRAPIENKRLRIIVLAIITIGLFSFVGGYWAANWFVGSRAVDNKEVKAKEMALSGTIPKKLDANQIINETEVVVVPKEALKKGEEKFTFTKTLAQESASAVDPFENQKPAPVTTLKKDEKEKKVKREKAPAKKELRKQAKKPARKKKVASVKAPKGKAFTIQVGSFANKKDAVNLQKRLKKKGYNAFLSRAIVRGKTWQRVQVGAFKTKSAAERTATRLKKNEKLPTYITSVKR